MDNKFYVSYEVAKLLKEKGHDKDVRKFYDEDGLLLEVEGFYNFEYLTNEELDNNHVAAPTKAEAIDWLESKGIIIGVKPYTAISFSYFILIDRKSSYDVIETNECFSTRLEAEDVVIIKALELL